MAIVDPYPQDVKQDLQLQGALALVNSKGQPGDFMPIDNSFLQQTLVLGIQWSRGSGADQILSRTAIPIIAAVAAALDAVLHAANAIVKTCAIIPKASTWILKSDNPKAKLVLELGEAFQHLVKAVGSVGMIAVAPLVTTVSPQKALELSDELRLTAGITFLAEQLKINPASLLDGWKMAKGPLRKVAFAVTEVALNFSWRPAAWTVNLVVGQAKAHPLIAMIVTIATVYLGTKAAGYGEEGNLTENVKAKIMEYWKAIQIWWETPPTIQEETLYEVDPSS